MSRRRVEKANTAMTNDLKRAAPVGETAELKRKTGVEIVSASSNRIVSAAVIDVTYGEFVIQGTRPHVIRAKRGGVLAFHWPKAGGVVFFAKVNHPGNAPNPFFSQVIGRWPDYLRRAQ
ncbi:MAG: hypothetical protein V3U46_04035 [Acidimicrobiia bacterium]